MKIRFFKFKSFSAALLLLCAACSEDKISDQDRPVRGLRVFEVSQSASTEQRRYPTLIDPANESRLSFEIGGQLGEVTLEEGQRVNAGDLLMQLDPTSLNFELQESRAALNQAEVELANAKADFERKSELLKNGNVTRASFDTSQTNLRTAESKMVQASRRADIAEERLSKSELRAPFEGVIANVEAKSFTNVSVGATVVTLYSQNAFEVGFSVPATVINQLSVGDEATVIITDLPNVTLTGKIQEISSRASQVSAFPVVVTLNESAPGLKAGMAAEAIISFDLLGSVEGFLIPLSSIDFEASKSLRQKRTLAERIAEGGDISQVFLFDAETSTVKATPVSIVGVRDNMLIIANGLKEGDVLASAGVSYLHDGQKVRRLPASQ
jgi:RND family efflux transporter MFP subunit